MTKRFKTNLPEGPAALSGASPMDENSEALRLLLKDEEQPKRFREAILVATQTTRSQLQRGSRKRLLRLQLLQTGCRMSDAFVHILCSTSTVEFVYYVVVAFDDYVKYVLTVSSVTEWACSTGQMRCSNMPTHGRSPGRSNYCSRPDGGTWKLL